MFAATPEAPPVLYQVPHYGWRLRHRICGASSFDRHCTPCSPVTDILNPNVTGGATEWIFASAQANGVSIVGVRRGADASSISRTRPGKPSTAYAVGQEVLDSNFQIQVVEVGGTSGATAPDWSTTAGGATTDGTVDWLDQGVLSAVTPRRLGSEPCLQRRHFDPRQQRQH